MSRRSIALSLLLALSLCAALALPAQAQEQALSIKQQQPVQAPLDQPNEQVSLTAAPPAVPEGFEPMASNDLLTLYARKDTGEIALCDLRDGFLWLSNPPEPDAKAKGVNKMMLQSQLIVQYSTERGTPLTALSQPDSVKGGGLTCEPIADGVRFTYEFAKQGLAVAVEYLLRGDFLEVSIPVEGLREGGLGHIDAIDLLPAMGAGKDDPEGYVFVPDGSGALLHYDNGNTSMQEYSAQVYGADPGIEGQLGITSGTAMLRVNKQSARLPVFGVRQSDHGLLALITENDAKAVIKARTSNLTSYNLGYSQFQYRSSGTMLMLKKEFGDHVVSVSERDGLTTGRYTVRYYPLAQGADYAQMAQTYRAYLKSERGMTQRVREGTYPLYLELFGYLKMPKQWLGFPYTATVPLTTLEDVRRIVRDIGELQTVVAYKQWVRGAVYERIPQKARPEPKLGSAEEMRVLDESLRSGGGGLYPDADMLRVTKTGNGFGAYRDAVLSPVNSPQMQYEKNTAFNVADNSVAPWYLLSPHSMRKFYSGYFQSYAKLGLQGLSLSGLGDLCYSDQGLRGFGRGNVPALVEEVLGEAQQTAASLLLEQGNAYAAVHADHLLHSPEGSSGFDITDEAVPFYQMVFHGAVCYGIEPTNLSSNPETLLLKCLEFGASPTFSLVGQNRDELLYSRMRAYYSADAQDWVEIAKRQHAELAKVLAPLSGRTITGHAVLSDALRRTDYGDVSIYVNYGDIEELVGGVTVPAHGYAVKGVLP